MHFWWPIVGVDPIPHWPMSHGTKMVALLIGVPIESFLALALLTTTRPAASMYSVAQHPRGCRRSCGWAPRLFTFLALIPVFVQWLRFEGRRTARIDAATRRRVCGGRDPTLTPVGTSHRPGTDSGRSRPGRFRVRPVRLSRRAERVGEGGRLGASVNAGFPLMVTPTSTADEPTSTVMVPSAG